MMEKTTIKAQELQVEDFFELPPSKKIYCVMKRFNLYDSGKFNHKSIPREHQNQILIICKDGCKQLTLERDREIILLPM